MIFVRLRDAALQLFVDLLGRFIFGSFSLLTAIGFGAIFVVLAQANPANIRQSLLRFVLMDLCVIVAAFLILAVIKFWSTAKWVDRWLASFTVRAGFIIVGFAMTVMAIGIVKQLAG